MSRLNIALTIVLGVFASMAILYGIYVLESGEYEKGLKGIFYYGLPALIIASALFWGNLAIKRIILFGFYLFFSVELLLQTVAFLGLLPRVHTYTHVPYGRVYYTKEGFANDHMNRFGWHAPAYRLDPNLRRISFIGDSFLLGIGVAAEENVGAILDRKLANGESVNGPSALFTIGKSNIGPAHYFELFRYAWRHFETDEAVIVLFLGNDYDNMLAPPESSQTREHRFYELLPNGEIALLPGAAQQLQYFVRPFDLNHRPVVSMLPVIGRSHFLLGEVIGEIRDGLIEILEQPELEHADDTIEDQFRNVGISGNVFRRPTSEKAQRTIRLVNGLLEKIGAFARERDIKFRLVTIPFFPLAFYDQYSPQEWTHVIGDYDLLWPDRVLKKFSDERDISFVSLANQFRRDGLTLEQIRTLYFNGTGHLTPKGHRYLANTIWERFYDPEITP